MVSSSVYGNCICIIIAIIFLIISGVNYQKHFEYQNTDCIISNITYPTSLYDKQNLVTCECGHRCRSDSGTCIRIYGSSIDNPEIYVMFLETTKKIVMKNVLLVKKSVMTVKVSITAILPLEKQKKKQNHI